MSRRAAIARLSFVLLFVSAAPLRGQAQPTPQAGVASPDATPAQSSTQPPAAVRVTCSSTAGVREHCAADTSSGVVLARSFGEAACLLGKTWGYDATGVWV